jgi:hypothetical protein
VAVRPHHDEIGLNLARLVDNGVGGSYAMLNRQLGPNPGRGERTPISLPPEFELTSIPSNATLSDMLAAGEIDGVITARAPACYTARAPNVDRLFPDFRSAEEAYYRKTRMFPIMHLLAIRRSLVETHPWLAASVVKAFYQAKQLAMAEMHEIGVLSTMLPWLGRSQTRKTSWGRTSGPTAFLIVARRSRRCFGTPSSRDFPGGR